MTIQNPHDMLDVVKARAKDLGFTWSSAMSPDGESSIFMKLAGPMACHHSGHLGMPRAKGKWSNQPWRCARCETWWISVREDDFYGGGWRWDRVKGPGE